MLQVIAGVCVVAYLIYWLGTRTYDHWASKGVPGTRPRVPFAGDMISIMLKQKPVMDFVIDLRKNFYDHRCAGFYNFQQPVLVINDPELIKMITVKDFDHFVNRNPFLDPEAEPMFGKSLLLTEDQTWRELRNTVSPAFTSAKMKNMFSLINDTSVQVVEHVRGRIQQQVTQNHKDKNLVRLDMKDLFTKYSSDVIASAVFGLKVDSLIDPDNEFYKMGKELTTPTGRNVFMFFLFMMFPKIMKFTGAKVFQERINQYYTRLILDTIKDREEKNIHRPDMIHLLMQARHEDQGKRGLADQELVSQSVLFFFAGFETVSTFLSFAAYEIAVNPDVQARLLQEIEEVLKEDDGQVTYDGVMTKMKYLDAVCNEVMRRWPPAPFTDRKVSKRYKIDGQNGDPDIYLEHNDIVWIPVSALHHDPNYFPNPEKFDPERFNEENKASIDPYTFLPFGTGPRNCVGMRFALMEAKACLIHLLRNFSFEVIQETDIPLKLSANALQMAAKNGYWIGLKPRQV